VSCACDRRTTRLATLRTRWHPPALCGTKTPNPNMLEDIPRHSKRNSNLVAKYSMPVRSCGLALGTALTCSQRPLCSLSSCAAAPITAWSNVQLWSSSSCCRRCSGSSAVASSKSAWSSQYACTDRKLGAGTLLHVGYDFGLFRLGLQAPVLYPPVDLHPREAHHQSEYGLSQPGRRVNTIW